MTYLQNLYFSRTTALVRLNGKKYRRQIRRGLCGTLYVVISGREYIIY
jgi:hypothetical protein